MAEGIQDFYNGKSIFVTGFTGFMGKVLAEKLLRSCHGLNKVYVLIRGKRNKTVQQRFEEVKKMQLFDRLKSEKPGLLESKLVALDGDIVEEGLGLTEEVWELLKKEVGVVFHVAASVRFNEPFTNAVQMNTLGTQRVVELALNMPNLQALVHVSTTYCNCDRDVVGETIYPEHADWRTTQSIIDKIDPSIVNILSKKYIGNLPNTYVFSKSMAEHVVWEQRYKIPVVILRPSIVVSTLNDPEPGWVDNFNGPVGILVAVGKGVIRTSFLDNSVTPDFMAVDVAIKAMIVAAWTRSQCRNPDDGCHIYNASSQKKSLKCQQMVEIGLNTIDELPLEQSLWWYSKHSTSSLFWFTINVWFKHLIPALIVDSILKMTGRKPILLDVHRKYYSAVMALHHFMTKSWDFQNFNFKNLNKRMLPQDRDEFSFEFDHLSPNEYFREAIIGGKKFLLHEKGLPLESVRMRANIFYCLDKLLQIVRWVLIGWLFVHCNVLQRTFNLFTNIIYLIFPSLLSEN